jgi:hypothetical protein
MAGKDKRILTEGLPAQSEVIGSGWLNRIVSRPSSGTKHHQQLSVLIGIHL